MTIDAPGPTNRNGHRLRYPGDTAIFLIDQGKKRHISDPQTYDNLFWDWEGIHEDASLPSIETGFPIYRDTILVQALRGSGEPVLTNGLPEIYILGSMQSNGAGIARRIMSLDAFNRYHFDWRKLRALPAAIIDSKARGEPIF